VVESWKGGRVYGVSSTLLKEEVMQVMILFHESGYFFEVGGRKNSVEQIVDVSNGIWICCCRFHAINLQL
jgi:hypothetical protein